MTYNQNRPVIVQTNGLGTAGFICSLVGLLTCGVLCPIGLTFSAIALFRQPRGMAIAGTIIGLIGSIVPLILGFLGIGFFSTCCLTFGAAGSAIATEGKTVTAIRDAQVRIVDYNRSLGKLPDDAEGTNLINPLRDGYGHPLHYKRLSEDQFEVRSAGRDGIFDTLDDRSEISSATGTTLPATAPRVEP